MIERKKISSTELMLFFLQPLPIVGAIQATKETDTTLPFLQDILRTIPAQTVLLTKDFLYLASVSEAKLEDLEALAIAEIKDWQAQTVTPVIADAQNTMEKAKIILKTIVAPFLQKDGGDIKANDYDNGILRVRFLGRCNGCQYAAQTLKHRVEKNLICYLPEIKEVKLI